MRTFFITAEFEAFKKCASTFSLKFDSHKSDSGIYEVVIHHANGDDLSLAFALMLGQQIEFYRVMDEKAIIEKTAIQP